MTKSTCQRWSKNKIVMFNIVTIYKATAIKLKSMLRKMTHPLVHPQLPNTKKRSTLRTLTERAFFMCSSEDHRTDN